MVCPVVSCRLFRSWSPLILTFVWAATPACERNGEPTAASPAEVEKVSAEPEEPTPSCDASETAAMDPIWDAAISFESDQDLYIVDSFVAAWLFARAERGLTPEWMPIDAKPDADPAGGYRLVEIPPGSPYTHLGLQVGDVVESLNGVVLSSPDRFGFALDGAESLVVLAVYREGTLSKRQYQLVGGATWSRQLADYAGEPDPTVVAEAPSFDDAPDGTVAADPPTGNAAPVPSPRTKRPATGAGARATKPRSSSGSSKPSSSPAGGSASKVQCTSSTRCTIEAAHFKQLVAAPSRLQSQVNVVPAIRNDVFSGYKLKSVKAGSDAARLGFRAGDKITHINGHDLTNEGEALQLYMSLGASRLFKIRYERGGRRLVKTVTVK
jgi:hypothetical protein